MFKINYTVDGQVKEVEFEKYYELVRFVAMNKIKDEDFVSLGLGETTINGIDELADYAIQKANEAEEAEKAYEEFLMNYEDADTIYDEAEDYEA